MPELDIGASQAEYIEELREALADEHLDGYGAMRPRDALQYLIDRHEATRPADSLVPDANGGADAAAGGGETAADGTVVDTDATPPDTSSTVAPSVDEPAAAMPDPSEPDGQSDESAIEGSDTAGSATVETVRHDADATSNDDADDDTPRDADATSDADADTASTEPSPSPSGSGSPLRQMMELLEEHDDAWEEVDSSDGKYRVTLPDGSTAHARTRDDVRALLFKHYR